MNSLKIGSVLLIEGTTRDNQIILDLFNNTIAEAHTLNMDHNFAGTFNPELRLLPPMQVGMGGNYRTGSRIWMLRGGKYRHKSQLFGFYPSKQILRYRNGEMQEAEVNLYKA